MSARKRRVRTRQALLTERRQPGLERRFVDTRIGVIDGNVAADKRADTAGGTDDLVGASRMADFGQDFHAGENMGTVERAGGVTDATTASDWVRIDPTGFTVTSQGKGAGHIAEFGNKRFPFEAGLPWENW